MRTRQGLAAFLALGLPFTGPGLEMMSLNCSLGAYHDGTQNTCTGKDQYIMASSPGVVTDENYLNLFTFSPCSITEFTKHLTFLNM